MKLIKTVSALLYYEVMPLDYEILLHKHKKLGKYMGAGGHVEEYEHELEALIREVKEETGLDIGCALQEERIDYQRYRIKAPNWVTRIKLDDGLHELIDHTYFIKVPKRLRNQKLKCEDGCEFEWVDLFDAKMEGKFDMFEDTWRQINELYESIQ